MKTPFTYSVLRYVHDITTGEFINVGVVLYSREGCYASALCRSTFGRLSKAFPGMDGDTFKRLMRFVQSRIEEIGDTLTQNRTAFKRPTGNGHGCGPYRFTSG